MNKIVITLLLIVFVVGIYVVTSFLLACKKKEGLGQRECPDLLVQKTTDCYCISPINPKKKEKSSSFL